MKNLNGCMGIVFVVVVIIAFIGMAVKGCEGCSSSYSSNYGNEQREYRQTHDRINREIEQDRKNHAEYEEAITCPKCNGFKHIPDLESSNSEFRMKECPECHGKGFVIVKRQW